MKLPSVQYLFAAARNSFLRFPLTILSALVAVVLGIYLMETGKDIPNILPFINSILCVSLGIPLYFCVVIIASKMKFDRKKIAYANLLSTLILVAVYFTLPGAESTHNTSLPYIKYGLYNATCHLLVAIMPFAFSKQRNGFWHYNKILFLRICLSVLYSGFIYVGLIIALTALRLLFDIEIHEELYFEIWILVIGLFNTWFFVSGIPVDFDHLDEIHEYPKGLRIFSQYVLLPLLGLYLLILYAYGTKILVSWNWPKGIVAYLIMFVSILGILTFLLLHPYGNQKEHSWIKKSSRGYYFVLIPLLVLLFIAIFMRINDYGITINRYAVLLLAVWISIVCGYTAFGKTNIKFIPTSLAVVLILISFGPWGMFSVSERSQVNRLRTILEHSRILVNGKIQNEPIWIKDSLPKLYSADDLKNESILSDTLHNEVKSIVEYLDNHHGFASVQDWYKQDLNAIVDTQKKNDTLYFYESESTIYMRSMGLKSEYINSNFKNAYIHYDTERKNSVTSITGYDYWVDFERYSFSTKENRIKQFSIDNTSFDVIYSDKPKISLKLNSKNTAVTFDLDALIVKLKNHYGADYQNNIPVADMTLHGSDATFDIKIELRTLDIETKKNKETLTGISGNIFIKKK